MMATDTISDYACATDSELVGASICGHHEAFGVIVTRYQRLVTGLLYNRCGGDISQSEELAQQTFVDAWQNLSKLRDRQKLSSWLCGIARNVYLHDLRQARKRAPKDPSVDIASIAHEPSQAAITREQEKILWQSLEKIPEKYREPMVLFYRQDQSVADVAQALDENEATIRKRLQRGRAMLRDQVAQVIEDTLRRSGPSAAFTMGVLAALPMYTGKASAATLGAGVVGKAAAGGKLVAFSMYLGPLVGIWGGIYGTMNSLRAARSYRERRFIIRSAIGICSGVCGLLLCQFALIHFRSAMSNGTYGILMSATWVIYASSLCSSIVYLNRRQARIRVEDGTDSIKFPDPPSPWSNKANVYGSIGGSLFGSLAWILAMAIQVQDWVWGASVVVTSLVAYAWCTQIIIRRGPNVVRRVFLAMAVYLLGTYALTINLRLNPWLAAGSENALSFGNAGAHVSYVPLWAANLFLVAISVAVVVPIYFVTQPKQSAT